MRIAFCSAEVSPFSQVGGLGDVAGSLPKALATLGDEMDVAILTPRYGLIEPTDLTPTDLTFEVSYYGQSYPIGISRGKLPGSDLPVWFLENEALFGSRQEVYPSGRVDLEVLGFDVFAKAIFPALAELDFIPDILHLNDWHTALCAPMLKDLRREDTRWQKTVSVLTIHNLLHQGVYEDLNRLEAGLTHADWLTTVSPTYAEEIQTPEYGAGLEKLLQNRCDALSGIINGIDTGIYDPHHDAFLSAHYTPKTAEPGKRFCKTVVQMELNLPKQPKELLIGYVGRLAEQKGLDILLPAIRTLCEQGLTAHWAILGSGDAAYEKELRALQTQYHNVRGYFGFNLALAHQIYAASDLFVMPSRFEPCGLGQLIALRYGAMPLVRATGGLKDTVHDVRQHPESGNGFVFEDYSSNTLAETLKTALDFRTTPGWDATRTRGMQEDHSWSSSAREYLNLYQRLAKPTVAPQR